MLPPDIGAAQAADHAQRTPVVVLRIRRLGVRIPSGCASITASQERVANVGRWFGSSHSDVVGGCLFRCWSRAGDRVRGFR